MRQARRIVSTPMAPAKKGKKWNPFFVLFGLLFVVLIFLTLSLVSLSNNIHRTEDETTLALSSVKNAKNDTKAMANKLPNQPLSQSSKPHESDWCAKVKEARSNLVNIMHINVPCEKMTPKAKSAIVCMLTDGTADDAKAKKFVFKAKDYINGALALGYSARQHIDTDQTHMLLLFRQGFEPSPEDRIRLEAVGWTIGEAPNFPLKPKYIPNFARYKTTYTKVTAIGLAEYECVMLMDADTLVVGDLRDILTCQILQAKPSYRLAGTLDWFRMDWKFFNTGSLLYKTDALEMNRVFDLTLDSTWMKRFNSDQTFLNHVYEERKNKTLNAMIAVGDYSQVPDNTQVVDMTWKYNAQTHAEVENLAYYQQHRPGVKILHFTEKKGWQCEERYEPLPPDKAPRKDCDKRLPHCFCGEGHLYWNMLKKARYLGDKQLKLSNGA